MTTFSVTAQPAGSSILVRVYFTEDDQHYKLMGELTMPNAIWPLFRLVLRYAQVRRREDDAPMVVVHDAECA